MDRTSLRNMLGLFTCCRCQWVADYSDRSYDYYTP